MDRARMAPVRNVSLAVAVAVATWPQAGRAAEPAPADGGAEPDPGETWYVLPDNQPPAPTTAAPVPPAPAPRAAPPAAPLGPHAGWHSMSPENKEEWVTTWYGWQTLLCDAATLSLWSLAALYHQNNGVRSASVAAGAVVYVWGPPAVHWSHRNSKRAGQSIALRLVLPIAGLLAGIVVGGSSGGGGGDDGLGVALVGFAGLTAGMITASVIDANHAEQPRRPRALSSVQPLFVPASGGGTLMLAGRF